MGKKEYAIFFAMVFELITLVLAFIYLGRYLDEKYDLGGFGTITGGILAIVIWGFHLMHAFKHIGEDKPESK